MPWGATWALPAYELALMTAARLFAVGTYAVEVTIVTPEHEPLQLFGKPASEAVRGLLEAGIDFVGGAYAVEAGEGQLQLLSDEPGRRPRRRSPRLRGQRIDGIPQTVEGFISVDDHCDVHGTDAVLPRATSPASRSRRAASRRTGRCGRRGDRVFAGAALVPHPSGRSSEGCCSRVAAAISAP